MDDIRLDETHFDALILGTGLVQSIVASAISRTGKSVLHLDRNEFYGENVVSKNLKEFKQWLEQDAPELADEHAIPRNVLDQWKELANDPNNNTHEYHAVPDIDRAKRCFSSKTELKISSSDVNNQPNEGDAHENNSEQPEPQPGPQPEPQQEDNAAQEPPAENENQEPHKTPMDILMEKFRSFSIDLSPRLLYSRRNLVDILIRSGVGKYVEFRAMNSMFLYLDGQFESVPCTKADIFRSSSITRVDKRRLVKFMHLILNDTSLPSNQSQNVNLEEYMDRPFSDLLDVYKFSEKVRQFILYSLALLDSERDTSDEKESEIGVKTSFVIPRLRAFLQSLGRYGNGAFLYPLYGCGELPQAFCRLCAVNSGIYILKFCPKCIVFDSTGDSQRFKGLVTPSDQFITSDFLVTNSSYLPNFVIPENDDESKKSPECAGVSRCVCITSSPLIEPEMSDASDSPEGTQPQHQQAVSKIASLIIPPNTVRNQNCAVRILQLDPTSSCVPQPYCLIYLSTPKSTHSKDVLKDIVDLLLPQTEESSNVVASAFYDQSVPQWNPDLAPDNVLCSPELGGDIGFNEAIVKAEEIFTKMYPECEFLPEVETHDFDTGDVGFEFEESDEEIDGI